VEDLVAARFPSSIEALTSGIDSFVREILPQTAAVEGQLLNDYLHPSTPVVIYGFGDIGRLLLAGLVRLGITPSAIVDSRLARTQSAADGIPCMSIEQGCQTFGKRAVFIVAVFNQSGRRAFAAIRGELQRFGVERVSYFMPVFWRPPEVFLPYYCFDLPSKLVGVRSQLLNVFRALSDDESRKCFAFHLYQLIAPSPELVLEATGTDDTYFPADLPGLSNREAFLDGGAFDGITLRRFLVRCGNEFASYLGVEPDPVNFAKLQAEVEEIRPSVSGKLEIRPCAIGRQHGEIGFAAVGTISSAATPSGGLSVPVVPLEELSNGFTPTMIKLDIEGFELEALAGGVEFLQEHRPKLAICVYHRQNDFWAIPQFVLENLPGYRLFMRRHKEYLDDFVLYALP